MVSETLEITEIILSIVDGQNLAPAGICKGP